MTFEIDILYISTCILSGNSHHLASNLISPSEYGLLQVPSYSVSFKLFSSSGLYHQTQPSLIFASHSFLSGLRQTFGAVGEVEFSKNIDFFLKFPLIGRKGSRIGALRVGGTSRLLDGILQMRQSSKLQISAVCFPEADCPVGWSVFVGQGPSTIPFPSLRLFFFSSYLQL